MKIIIRHRESSEHWQLVLPIKKLRDLLDQFEPIMNKGDRLIFEGEIEF